MRLELGGAAAPAGADGRNGPAHCNCSPTSAGIITINHARERTLCAPEANAGTSRPVQWLQASMSATCSSPEHPEKNATGGVPAKYQHGRVNVSSKVGTHAACTSQALRLPRCPKPTCWRRLPWPLRHSHCCTAVCAAQCVTQSATGQQCCRAGRHHKARFHLLKPGPHSCAVVLRKANKQEAPGPKGWRSPHVGKVAGVQLRWHCNQPVVQETKANFVTIINAGGVSGCSSGQQAGRSCRSPAPGRQVHKLAAAWRQSRYAKW